MKKIVMMGGVEIFISDKEAEAIAKLPSDSKLVKLLDGSLINLSSLSCIVDFKGNPFLAERDTFHPEEIIRKSRIYEARDKSFFFINKDGERVSVPFSDFKYIEYILPEDENEMIRLDGEKHRALLKENMEREKELKKKSEEEIRKAAEEKAEWDALPVEEKRRRLEEKMEKLRNTNGNEVNQIKDRILAMQIKCVQRELDSLDNSTNTC